MNYTLLGREGWVELKFLPKWPVKPETPVRFRHFTHEQVIWAENRHSKGGRAGLLAQVGREYLLVRPQHMREVQRGAIRARLYELAAVHGQGAFPTTAILKLLIRTLP